MPIPIDHRRRGFAVALGAGFAAALVARAANAETLARTVRMYEGPFYPDAIPLDHDNDLTRVDGVSALARGLPADVTGRVVDANGRAIAGAAVEIWQCDASGHYHHVGDDAGLDPGFQGYGRITTDARGRYRFRTIRPVKYGGRCPHIHFKVRGAGIENLTTQMFVADDPANADDFIYASLSPEQRASVTVPFLAGEGDALRASFEIVAGVAPSGI